MISVSELMLRAGECSDIADRLLVKLGKSIQSIYGETEHYPPQLLAEAYIDYKARIGEPIDNQSILIVEEVGQVDSGFQHYLNG